MQTRFLKLGLIGISSLFLFACSSAPKVSYQDPNKIETVTADYGVTDLQMLAESMTRSLLQTRVIMNSPTPPIITVAPVKNKTSEYIDTNLITNKIETQLLKSGQVRFAVKATDMSTQVGELTRQNSGMYNKETVSKIGNMEGAKYRIEGEIGSIVKSDKNVKDVFYNLTLRLINNETGTYEWQDEKEIRKQQRR
jgi:penicillin-binding protein activator